MATATKQRSWYVSNSAGGHQGVVACEQTGRSVAVVYDPEDTPLLAAAPAMLESLRECITDDGANCIVTNDVAYLIRRLRAINRIASEAITKADAR